jgi:penicillin-binding protein activator
MRWTKSLIALAGIMLLLLPLSCAKRVERVSADKVTDISGRWNDTDSQQVAKAIVTDCMAQQWHADWTNAHPDKKPVVIVGTIINKSQEHINVDTFVKDIQTALINSGKVRFVSSKGEREEVRQERRDQQEGYTAEDTRAGVGQETGADYMMKGTLNAIVDEMGDSKAVWYQVNVELHNLTSNEIVWVGQHKIKKVIDKSSVRW